MSTADIYEANVKTLKANAEVLADTQNALLKHIFEGGDISSFLPLFTDEAIASLSVPEGVASIAPRAFMGRGVGHLILSSSVESIGDRAFSGVPAGMVIGAVLTQLTAITFGSPSALKTIGDSAFASNYLESLVLPDGLEAVGRYALVGIGHVTLPSTVTAVGPSAFQSCNEVTFLGKTIAEVQAMANYPWDMDIYAGTFHCTDGDITF